MNNRTCIMLELSLVFDNDTDVENVTKEIGIAPSDSKNKNMARSNPFYRAEKKPRDWPYQGEKMPGYWEINTGYIESLDFEKVADCLLSKIQSHLPTMKRILKRHSGIAQFCVVPKIYDGETPSLCFTRSFLEAVEFLNATIDIDMYIYTS